MKFSAGDKVRLGSDPTRIGVVEALGPVHGDMQFYKVFWGDISTIVAESDLKPYVEADTPEANLVNGNLAKYQDFQRLITYHRLLRDFPLDNNIYAFNASRTRFYPYQFKPLVKFLDSPHHRILICDEVGLGKTIEAGLILTELRARQTVNRVLVVCPANLLHKWRWELRRRFGEDFRILSSKEFLDYLDEFEEFEDRCRLNGIISLESCRTDKVLERLEELVPSFDLVIVDEAHHMRNFGRKQRAAGVRLSQCTNAMIMLTATPVMLGSLNLYSLLNILDDEEFRDQYTVDQLFRENEPIIFAQICAAQIPPQLEKAGESLRKIRNSPWIEKNPLYEQILSKVKRLAGQPDAQGGV